MSALPASSTPRHRRLLPVLVVVISLMVGGGLVAREFYQRPQGVSTAMTVPPGAGDVAPDAEPGPATVRLTPDAAAHPQHEAVRALMQTYFDAINRGDYDAWRTTVTRVKIAAQPRPDWQANYRSTRDGSIVIYRIDPSPGNGLNVLIGFTSVQDPSAAPPELRAGCLRWRLVFPLTLESGRWKLDSGPQASTLEVSQC
ncbi:hypothetical protein [Amycolatopsis pigmentata]|uniref:Mce-associated membrane protein n=1 Tax=Amycolatopsis pigmentata TaxID=450801 RepID=A0ABW5FXM2_9PSEU